MSMDSSFIKENWFKLSLIIVLLVLGTSYIGYLKTKEHNQVLAQELAAQQKKLDQEKQFAADRKSDCLTIYTTESDKWNNVRGWRYSETEDVCYIRYRETNPKADSKCDEDYPVGGEYGFTFLRLNALCKDGEFENSF